MVEILKDFYQSGLYTADDLKAFVACGTITATEYQQITGVAYS